MFLKAILLTKFMFNQYRSMTASVWRFASTWSAHTHTHTNYALPLCVRQPHRIANWTGIAFMQIKMGHCAISIPACSHKSFFFVLMLLLLLLLHLFVWSFLESFSSAAKHIWKMVQLLVAYIVNCYFFFFIYLFISLACPASEHVSCQWTRAHSNQSSVWVFLVFSVHVSLFIEQYASETKEDETPVRLVRLVRMISFDSELHLHAMLCPKIDSFYSALLCALISVHRPADAHRIRTTRFSVDNRPNMRTKNWFAYCKWKGQHQFDPSK